MLADADISSLGYLWCNTPAIRILHTMANSFSRDLLYDHNHAGSSLLHDQTAVVGTCCSNAQWQNHVAISVTCHENNFALKFVHNALKRKREHKEALWTIYMENRVIPNEFKWNGSFGKAFSENKVIPSVVTTFSSPRPVPWIFYSTIFPQN